MIILVSGITKAANSCTILYSAHNYLNNNKKLHQFGYTTFGRTQIQEKTERSEEPLRTKNNITCQAYPNKIFLCYASLK